MTKLHVGMPVGVGVGCYDVFAVCGSVCVGWVWVGLETPVKIMPTPTYSSDVHPHGGCLGGHEPRKVLDGLLRDVRPQVDPHRSVGDQRGKSGVLLLTAGRHLCQGDRNNH